MSSSLFLDMTFFSSRVGSSRKVITRARLIHQPAAVVFVGRSSEKVREEVGGEREKRGGESSGEGEQRRGKPERR
jgi:hypothetical protein